MQVNDFTRGQIRPFESVKEAWTLIKDDYWLLFAISLVGAMIGGVSLYVLIGAMICGIIRCYLKKIDGEAVAFDDLWTGFSYFGRSLLVTIVIVVPIVVYILATFTTLYLPIVMKAVGGSRVSDEEMLTAVVVGLAIDAVIAIVMVFVHSLLIFSFL